MTAKTYHTQRYNEATATWITVDTRLSFHDAHDRTYTNRLTGAHWRFDVEPTQPMPTGMLDL